MGVAIDFDQLSSGYTEKITRWLPYYRQMLEGVLRPLPDDFRPARILDLGCGDGNLTALLWQAFPDARITLLDASEEMLEKCRLRFPGFSADSFVASYFQEVHFSEGSFDLVTAAFSIHHLKGKEKLDLFRRIHTWLRPGGYLSMTDLYIHRRDEPEYSRMLEKWRREAEALGTTPDEWDWIIEHRDHYDYTDNFVDQVNWLREAGFERVGVSWRKDYWGCLLAGKGHGR